eukprot:5304332-Amphidinium_carterae.1
MILLPKKHHRNARIPKSLALNACALGMLWEGACKMAPLKPLAALPPRPAARPTEDGATHTHMMPLEHVLLRYSVSK